MIVDLLEIGELVDFYVVVLDFLVKVLCVQCWVFLVVFDEVYIMDYWIKVYGVQVVQIQFLYLWWVGFDDDLILIVMLQLVWVFVVMFICWMV